MATVKGTAATDTSRAGGEGGCSERAAAASHLNVSAFVLQAAAFRAEEVLAERQSIRLTPEAAEAFTEALDGPMSVNERLARALKRPRGFTWLD